MKVSLNWVKQYIDFELPPIDELVEKIGAQLGAVEEVINLGEKYQNIIIAKVASCEKHPDADRLKVCRIDDGGVAENVDRGEDGLVQVICGAPNVEAGVMVAWLPPGATVPASFNDQEPFVLETRELRGVKSNGMLASPKELAIGDSHEGLLLLDADMVTPSGQAVEPGADFALVFGLNDYIIDIENKMFTHRPDCFGILGVAREIAGILGHQFTSPEWYLTLAHGLDGTGLALSIDNSIPERVPRFMAVALKNVVVMPSPLWLQIELAKVGAKPINNVVDVTNYMMLLTGQPLHAYDYDKVASGKLGARFAAANETLQLLNGKTIKLDTADTVITDSTKPIGLAGVMGGQETEVTAETKNIILECASFDMYTVRRTSMRHGLFTDAVTRFNKGQSPLQNPHVMQHAIGQIKILTGAELASGLIDDNQVENQDSLYAPVNTSATFINQRLGLQLASDDIKMLLEDVEFKVESDEDNLLVTAPFWRTDIEQPEDIVEEVGRLYGFDKLLLTLPSRDLTPASKNSLLELKNHLRHELSKAGANEVLTYSFVHGNLLDKVGQDKSQAFQLSNALSPDLQYYRMSLTPSLLDRVHANIKAGYSQFALFEIGKAHVVDESDHDEPKIPKEVNALAAVIALDQKAAQKYVGSPYYLARKYLMQVLKYPVATAFEPLENADLYNNHWIQQMVAPFEPRRSAVLRDQQGLIWGVVGEYRTAVCRALKLPDFSAGFEADPLLFVADNLPKSYVPVPRFPKVLQDISLKVPSECSYWEIYKTVWERIVKCRPPQTHAELSHRDIYQSEEDKAHKNITFRLSIASYERTLTDNEVNNLLDQAAMAAHEKFGAERI